MPEVNYLKYRSRILATAKKKRDNRTPEKRAADNKRDRERWAKRPKNPLQKRDYFLKYRYGITLIDFLVLLASQDGLCKCCGQACKRWHVDHEHGVHPMKIRGVLCHRCNVQLGQLGDNPANVIATCDKFLRYLGAC